MADFLPIRAPWDTKMTAGSGWTAVPKKQQSASSSPSTLGPNQTAAIHQPDETTQRRPYAGVGSQVDAGAESYNAQQHNLNSQHHQQQHPLLMHPTSQTNGGAMVDAGAFAVPAHVQRLISEQEEKGRDENTQHRRDIIIPPPDDEGPSSSHYYSLHGRGTEGATSWQTVQAQREALDYKLGRQHQQQQQHHSINNNTMQGEPYHFDAAMSATVRNGNSKNTERRSSSSSPTKRNDTVRREAFPSSSSSYYGQRSQGVRHKAPTNHNVSRIAPAQATKHFSQSLRQQQSSSSSSSPTRHQQQQQLSQQEKADQEVVVESAQQKAAKRAAEAHGRMKALDGGSQREPSGGGAKSHHHPQQSTTATGQHHLSSSSSSPLPTNIATLRNLLLAERRAHHKTERKLVQAEEESERRLLTQRYEYECRMLAVELAFQKTLRIASPLVTRDGRGDLVPVIDSDAMTLNDVFECALAEEEQEDARQRDHTQRSPTSVDASSAVSVHLHRSNATLDTTGGGGYASASSVGSRPSSPTTIMTSASQHAHAPAVISSPPKAVVQRTAAANNNHHLRSANEEALEAMPPPGHVSPPRRRTKSPSSPNSHYGGTTAAHGHAKRNHAIDQQQHSSPDPQVALLRSELEDELSQVRKLHETLEHREEQRQRALNEERLAWELEKRKLSGEVSTMKAAMQRLQSAQELSASNKAMIGTTGGGGGGLRPTSPSITGSAAKIAASSTAAALYGGGGQRASSPVTLRSVMQSL